MKVLFNSLKQNVLSIYSNNKNNDESLKSTSSFYSLLSCQFRFRERFFFENKSRLFNFTSNAVFRLISKKAEILTKQKRCFKCKKLKYITSMCKSEHKFMSTKLKEIVKLFNSKNKFFFYNREKRQTNSFFVNITLIKKII